VRGVDHSGSVVLSWLRWGVGEMGWMHGWIEFIVLCW
jgi:hypothetical protein